MREFHSSINELYEELYTTNVMFQLLDEENTEVDDIYKESQNKKYKDPIILLAKIKLKPKLEEISLIGQQKLVDGTVTCPYLEMVKHELDKHSITTLCKGKITFANTEYDIINVVPHTTFNNEISKCSFEIRRCI